MRVIPLIMAGGKGERFWPKSRQRLPKQFLNLLGDQSMLQLTVNRLQKLVPLTDIHIVTGEEYAALVKEQLPDLPVENIILEPVGKNTAPCIGLAATILSHRYGSDAIIIVVPSDHVIMDEEHYLSILQAGVKAAQGTGDPLVTVGIVPTGPETAYGYIKVGQLQENLGEEQVYLVDQFVEKPDYKTAEQYIQAGDYYWNSGMFIFKIAAILNNMGLHLPELKAALDRIGQTIDTEQFASVLDCEYRAMQSISIDYGVMEKAERVMVIPGEFGWDDVGSWTSMERINQVCENKNIIRGNVISLDNHGCIVEAGSKQRLVAILGADDLIVVDTEDAILICPKSRAQDVKKILENLKATKQEQYL